MRRESKVHRVGARSDAAGVVLLPAGWHDGSVRAVRRPSEAHATGRRPGSPVI